VIALPAKAVIRWRVVVIGAWAAAALLLVPRAAHVHDVLTVRGSGTERSESMRSTQLLRSAFPNPVAEFVAVLVQGPVTNRDRRYTALLDTISARLRGKPYVRQVISASALGDSLLRRGDGRTTLLIVSLVPPPSERTPSPTPDIRATLDSARAAVPWGSAYTTQVTGGPALDYDARVASTADSREGERRVLPLALVVLVLAFGALVAAMLPVLVGLLAITIALGLVTLAAEFHSMSIFVLTITTMVGLGVGIDYSLLIVTRFREELNRGLNSRDAAVRAIQTAGSAVLISGLTVTIGFAALLTTPLVETRSVGIGGLLVVATCVLLATTFLPAVLSFLGRNIDRPRWLARPLARFHAPTGWERWARWLGHHPWHAIALGGVPVLLLTWPLVGIRIGLPASNWFPREAESAQALTTLRDMGAGGALLPTRIVIQVPEGESVVSARRIRGLKAMGDSLQRDPRVKQVRSVVNIRPRMSVLQYVILYGNVAEARARAPAFYDAYLSLDNRTALMDVIYADSTSLTTAMDVARRARQVARSHLPGLDGAEILVGGFAASNVDLQEEMLDEFPLVGGLILGTTAVMLFFAFRSLLVPIKAVLLNCLSVASAFGVTVLVFQHGYGGQLFGLEGPTTAVWVVVPVIVFAVVFGLSMDYEVFLLTRIKEVFDRTGRNDYATMEGLSTTASTITSAAFIMIIVFGAFAFARVLAVQLMGFALATAVLLDATLIRMVLVPAIMHIAGRWNWWPGVRAPKEEKAVE
jgi:putative drug exporter of the RND superfamily